MKFRDGFVSNSSSSSFIIGKSKLSQTQIEQIKDYYNVGLENNVGGYFGPYSNWEITETEDYIKGFTIIDNFSMRDFLAFIGVKTEDIEWWSS